MKSKIAKVFVGSLVLPIALSLYLTGIAVAQICVEPPAGLISWWPGDGNAEDIQGSNTPTQTFGAPQFVTAKVAQGILLNGHDGYAIPNNTSLDFGANDSFTLDAWVRIDGDSPRERLIVDKRRGIVGYILGVLGTGQGSAARSFYFFMRDVSGNFVEVRTPPVTDSNFHHVAAVVDRTNHTVAIYLDGGPARQTVSSTSVGALTNTGRFFIGHQSLDVPGTSGIPLTGIIDELALFSRALAQAEIQAIFTAGSAGKCTLLGQCQEDLTAAQQQIQDLQTQVAEADLALDTCQLNNAQLQTRVNTLTSQNQALTQQNTQLQQQVTTLTQANQALTAQNSQLQTQVNSLTTQNTQLQNQVTTLTQQNQTLTQANETLTAQNQNLTAQHQTLTQQNTQLQQQVATLTQANQALTTQLAQFQQAVQDLQDQLTQLTTELVRIQNDFRVVFHNPTFVLPGATLVEQYHNLVTAILNLNQGRKMGIYTNLGGRP